MGVIIVLVLAGLMVSGGFLFAFLWALDSGQYDDVETPAHRVLFEDTCSNRRVSGDER